ncbi:sugar phosphate isomerase/epimerase family protein [Paenibacillus spongiae]|uniref:Sugar phosphate isomerase/epimerase n=1 Tax=Paenibacillus spongiae TaxID=2909671 RepID=A0ABY5SFB7_9BACL|nr:sugar phosphate isomerase/epimerase [Paenibacillus spongiae]UVI32626.1 sugar phosphate isomerase/epimerase [Paenibacillus spongiae]
MKLGVFISSVFSELSFEQMLDFVQSVGMEALELGTGNYAGNAFVKLDELLADEYKRKAFLHAIESRGLFIAAFSVQGNPLHPDRTIAKEHHETFIKTIQLANKMGVPIVNNFSGQPGTPYPGIFPNFVTVSWPPEYPQLNEWQWNHVVIPYWKEAGRYAALHQVKIGIELHPGFAVHSPATLLRLRHAVGDVIGASFDASHLWTQGINPVEAVKILGYAGALYFVSTKDMEFNEFNMNMYGINDIQPSDSIRTRAWIYRTVGYGHDIKIWADLISALQMTGYSYVFSIEQNDPLMDMLEGVTKAANLMKEWLIRVPYRPKRP